MNSQKLTPSFINNFVAGWAEEFIGESLQRVGYSLTFKTKSNISYMIDTESQYVILAVAPSTLNMDHINEWQKARFDLMTATNSKSARVIVISTEAQRKYHALFKLFRIEFWFIAKEDMAFRIQQLRQDIVIEYKPDGEFESMLQKPKLTAKNILQALGEKGNGPNLNGAYVFWLKSHHAEHSKPYELRRTIDEFDLADLSEDEIEVLKEGNTVKRKIKYDEEDDETYDMELNESLLPEQVIIECAGLFGYDRDDFERLEAWFDVIRDEEPMLLIDKNSPFDHTKSYRRGRVNALSRLQLWYREEENDGKINTEKIESDLKALQSVALYAGKYPNLERLRLFTGFSLKDDTPKTDITHEGAGKVWSISFEGLDTGHERLIREMIEHLKHHAGKVESFAGLSIWDVRKLKSAPLSKITIAQPCPKCFQRARPIKDVPEEALLLGSDHFRAPGVFRRSVSHRRVESIDL